MAHTKHDRTSEQEALPPHPVLRPHYSSEEQRRPTVTHLFDTSARHYDRISSLMSFGTDRAYRRWALKQAGLREGMRMLDVACGTGMIAEAASRIVGAGGAVIGVDPSMGMLNHAIHTKRLQLAVRGEAEGLPFPDDYFDMLCMGFALRHVADLRKTFHEYRRVLKPGGRALILEITAPSSRLSFSIFKIYLKYVVPAVTRFVTFNPNAYSLMSYFWDTVEQCVAPVLIMETLEQAGFQMVNRDVRAGVFSEYTAIKGACSD